MSDKHGNPPSPPFFVRLSHVGFEILTNIISFPQKIVQIKRNDLDFLVWLEEDVGKHLYLLRSYERGEALAYSKIVQGGDVCLDVGGNIGFHSLNLAKLCGEEGEVHVFEPIRKNILIIELSAEINNLKNIIVNPYVISDVKGQVEFDSGGDSAYSHIANKKSLSMNFHESTTIDNYVEETGLSNIKFLKIDVEGAEGLVLRGAKNVLSKQDSQPRVVMAELISRYLDRYDFTIDEIIQDMYQYGYKSFYVDYHGNFCDYSKSNYDKVHNIFFISAGFLHHIIGDG